MRMFLFFFPQKLLPVQSFGFTFIRSCSSQIARRHYKAYRIKPQVFEYLNEPLTSVYMEGPSAQERGYVTAVKDTKNIEKEGGGISDRGCFVRRIITDT